MISAEMDDIVKEVQAFIDRSIKWIMKHYEYQN
jgi:hypothetical protein